MLNGTNPNPNLVVHRRGPNQKRRLDGTMVTPTRPSGTPSLPAHQQVQPSLTRHLLDTNRAVFNDATQQPFLSHAGYGTLSPAPLLQWLVQDSHYARGFVQFIGQLLAKIRLPIVQNSQFHPMYRTMDLLITSLNNIRREMSFFEITATKYGLNVGNDPPTPITRAYLDLFISASSASASLLEGMVVLWATEHVRICPVSYAYALITVVLPLRLDVRRPMPLFEHALERLRTPHRRAAPIAHPELDLARLLQIRGSLPQPRRRARQLRHRLKR